MQLDSAKIKDAARTANESLFGGRIARTTFAIRVAIFAAIVFTLAAPLGTILAPSSQTLKDAYLALSIAVAVLCGVGFVSAYVKRLHDMRLRGYWGILFIVVLPYLIIQAGYEYTNYRYLQNPTADLSGVYDLLFVVPLAFPLLIALWRGERSENKFGPVPEPVEHVGSSSLTLASVAAAAVILVPTAIYAGLFQSGVWVGRGASAPSMPMIDSMSNGRLLAKCWNIKGVGAGTGAGALSGVYRDGYGDLILDFVVHENGEIDVVPAGTTLSKAYRADGFDIYSYGLTDPDGEISVGDRTRFLIAAVYDGETPEENVNFTTFAFAKTGEIWPEWQMIMSTGISLGPQPVLQTDAQARGRLMVADCVVR